MSAFDDATSSLQASIGSNSFQSPLLKFGEISLTEEDAQGTSSVKKGVYKDNVIILKYLYVDYSQDSDPLSHVGVYLEEAKRLRQLSHPRIVGE